MSPLNLILAVSLISQGSPSATKPEVTLERTATTAAKVQGALGTNPSAARQRELQGTLTKRKAAIEAKKRQRAAQAARERSDAEKARENAIKQLPARLAAQNQMLQQQALMADLQLRQQQIQANQQLSALILQQQMNNQLIWGWGPRLPYGTPGGVIIAVGPNGVSNGADAGSAASE